MAVSNLLTDSEKRETLRELARELAGDGGDLRATLTRLIYDRCLEQLTDPDEAVVETLTELGKHLEDDRAAVRGI
ncbi:MAG TPA: hypothetical protein VMR74_08555 [Gammaproteobacteria bacterium]|nr:hypothetical protein [Gammaproteobacteria bacterium]